MENLNNTGMSFQNVPLLGYINYIDNSKALIELDNENSSSLINIGSLVAIQTTRSFEYVIGIVDSIQRQASEKKISNINDDYEIDSILDLEQKLYETTDLAKVYLLGTYKNLVYGVYKKLDSEESNNNPDSEESNNNPDSEESNNNLDSEESNNNTNLIYGIYNKQNTKDSNDNITSGTADNSNTKDSNNNNSLIYLGIKKFVFKRGIDIYPQISNKCFPINGDNLKSFMEIINVYPNQNKCVPINGDNLKSFMEIIKVYSNQNKYFPINGDNLKSFMKIIKVYSNQNNHSLNLGNFAIDLNSEANINTNKFFKRHAAILGNTGSGKSYCVKNILKQLAQLDKPNVIVFDIHGEYKKLINNTNLKDKFLYFSFIDPQESMKEGIQKCDKDTIQNIYLPYWMLNFEEFLAIFFTLSEDNAHVISSNIKQKIEKLRNGNSYFDISKLQETQENKENKNINILFSKIENKQKDARYKFLFPSCINDSLEQFLENGKLNELLGDDKFNELSKKYNLNELSEEYKLKELLGDDKFNELSKKYNLNELSEEYKLKELLGEYKLKELLEADKVKILDLSNISSDMLYFVTGVLARLIFEAKGRKEIKSPLALFCEEAHLYLPNTQPTKLKSCALENFERIAKEGRKYGLSLIAISQRPSEINHTILSQCNNFVVLKLTNDRDQFTIKNLVPESIKTTLDQLPILDVGEALVIGDSILLPSKIKLKDLDGSLGEEKDFISGWS